jgi:phosphoglycolate phosphatase
MNNHHYRAVIFDFDYTLADSSAPVTECINCALAGMGLPEVPREAACATIGLSLPETFRKLAGAEHAGKEEEFVARFARRADEVMVDQTAVYSSVKGVLRQLTLGGLGVGIVSTKYRHRIEAILRREGLREGVGVIVGGEDVTRHKPDPAGLLLAIEKLAAEPARALYVGDSVADAQTARQAGVTFVAVLSGVTPEGAFRPYPVAAVLEDVSKLPKFLQGGGER